MMYIYRADTYCDDCGNQIRTELPLPPNVDNEYTYDSDYYPKGPYPVEESDSPQVCGECGDFLENPLTSDGEDYVRERWEDMPVHIRDYYADLAPDVPNIEGGDITSFNDCHWYQHGKLYHTGDRASLADKMESDGFMPDVYIISDHGNPIRITGNL